MNLALLIYAITVFSNINRIAHAFEIISICCLVILSFIFLVSHTETETDKFRETIKKILKIDIIIFVLSISISTIIPTEKTSYLMVGGYLAENVVKSEQFNNTISKSGEIVNKLTKIVNNKLDQYVEETSKNLIEEKK